MSNPSQIYEDLQKDSLEGRELEAAMLIRAARKLDRCSKAWDDRDSREGREKLGDALAFNQKLWNFLQVELSNPDHPMPLPLRRNLLRLGRYVDQRILRLASGGSQQDLLSLVRINEELATGLLQGVPRVETLPSSEGSHDALDISL